MKNFLKKLSKIISNILFWILMGVIILLVFYIVTIKIYAKQNRLDEIKFNMYTILTTSMEKTIMAGDVVVDYKNKDNIYELGDIITFYSNRGNGQITITHRIIDIKIENGNNIYFNEIDINSCKYGFWANAVKAIYNLFVNKMNLTGCINSVWFYAKDQYIARVKMSEVSIYSFPNSEVGILFSRVAPYSIEDSVFTDLFDSVTTEADFIRIEDIGMNSSVFDGIRTNNKLSGLSHVRKVGVLPIPTCGEFIVPAGTIGQYNHIVSSSSPFDYNPVVTVSPQRNVALSSTCSNVQMGNLTINVLFEEELQQDLLVRYSFPQF